MKYYLTYILVGVLIGLLVLILILLVGCEETDATPYNEHDVEMKLRILAIEARLNKQQQISTDMWADLENTKMAMNTFANTDAYISDIDPNAPINTHLLKPSDSWAKEYGTSHESVLKYNVVAAWAFAQRALQQIAELDKRVKALEPEIIDPNEVKE